VVELDKRSVVIGRQADRARWLAEAKRLRQVAAELLDPAAGGEEFRRQVRRGLVGAAVAIERELDNQT
jgi:hypothetical protein